MIPIIHNFPHNSIKELPQTSVCGITSVCGSFLTLCIAQVSCFFLPNCYLLKMQNSLQQSSQPSKLSIYLLICITNNKHVASQECQNNSSESEMPVMEEKVSTGMCFGFLTNVSTQLTVHACDMDTQLKLR